MTSTIEECGKIKKIIMISQPQFDKLFVIEGDVIDHGTYGYVQKGLDLEKHTIVALKTIKEMSSRDTFEIQQSMMSQIQHKNVLKSYGLYYIMEKTKLILVTPFCANGNLKKCIEEVSKKDYTFKLNVCLQLAEGLAAIHEKNYMHRDIKPGNILFDQHWTPIFCDFGFAKRDNDYEKTTRVGTLSYRDPNVQTGTYSKKCDIYSLGLVFFFIYKGSSPFKETESTFFERETILFQNQNRKRVEQLEACPDYMKQILKGCLEKNQFYRYDADKLVRELIKAYKKQTGISINNSNFFFSSENTTPGFFEEESQSFLKKDINLVKNQKKFEEQQTAFETAFENPRNLRKNTEYSTPNEKFDPMRFSQNLSRQKSEKSSSLTAESMSGLSKILKSKLMVEDELKKSKNAKVVYQYFIDRKLAIKELKNVCSCEKLEEHELKLLICACLFGYYNFLRRKTVFFANKSQQDNIEGVTLEEMSERMFEQCTKLISKQIKSTKIALKGFIDELYSNRELYGASMPSLIKQMVNCGKEKQFDKFEEFKPSQIKKEVQELIKRSERILQPKALESLEQIIMIFK